MVGMCFSMVVRLGGFRWVLDYFWEWIFFYWYDRLVIDG